MELKAFPDKDKYEIKKAFEERYRGLLGDRYDEYLRYSLSFLTRSIRVNTLKISSLFWRVSFSRSFWMSTSASRSVYVRI